jgi:tRNA(Ile)-lysidine synthase
MSDLLLERVRAFLTEQDLLRPEALLLVAVSGGPDSLCLLHLLTRLRTTGGPRLHVAHLDHGARGAQATAEAAAVAALAGTWSLPVTVEHCDVPALARASGVSFMAAARQARYAFLARLACHINASAVAVAHQADDQAETVLLHALRGAGLAGLRGMRPLVPWHEWAGERAQGTGNRGEGTGEQGNRGTEEQKSRGTEEQPSALSPQPSALSPQPSLIRPLLTTSRAAIMAYCAEHALRPSDDPSNRAPHYARTRVRALLPSLAAENPQLVTALGRTARLLADDYAYIQHQLDVLWPELASEQTTMVSLHRAPWDALHPALQRYALRRAAAGLGQSELSMEQVEAARQLATRPGRQLRLGALNMIVDQTSLKLTRPQTQPYLGAPQLAAVELPLVCPGLTPLGDGWACLISADPPAPPDHWWLALDQNALDGPLSLRRRRPGDRFRPVDAPGSRKLQDFFVDHKLPRALRDAWPLLATPTAIVWVVGLRPDTRFLAGPQSQSTIWVGLIREPD